MHLVFTCLMLSAIGILYLDYLSFQPYPVIPIITHTNVITHLLSILGGLFVTIFKISVFVMLGCVAIIWITENLPLDS